MKYNKFIISKMIIFTNKIKKMPVLRNYLENVTKKLMVQFRPTSDYMSSRNLLSNQPLNIRFLKSFKIS